MPAKPKATVTNRIRELRFGRGQITQQELADRVEVTRQTIIALEANKYVPSLLLAFRIAEALQSPLEEVFHFNGKSARR